MIPESNGTVLDFRYSTISHHKYQFSQLDIANDAKGLSNTARGKISAQTNLKNYQISLDKDLKELHLKTPTGSKRIYVRLHGYKPDEKDWGIKGQVLSKYLLTSEQLPNGNYIKYEWDKDNILKKIWTTDPTGKITYASAKFHYFGKVKTYKGDLEKYKNKKYQTKGDFEVITSDGRTLRYEYSREGKPKVKCRWNLRCIKSSCYPTEQLSYDHKIFDKQVLTDIRLPDNRFVGFTYYHLGNNDLGWFKVQVKNPEHPNYGRVKDLLAPIGYDATRHTSYRFNYDAGNRVTGVLDIAGNATNYYWDPDFRLLGKNRLNGSQLYSSEKFVWGTEENASNLLCKSFLDSSSTVVNATRYHYDSKGNVLQENFYGNLSGLSSNSSLDSQGFPAADEVYTKHYRYTDDARNLLICSEEQNGLKIHYEYLPNTNLCIKELTYDKDRLVQRKFYGYNQYRTVGYEITDDGSSPNENDFSNIRTRTFKVITPYHSGPYIGMPHIIEENYWNGSHDVRLKKTVLHYTTGGKICQKDIYDASNVHRYSLSYKYNSQGQLIEETNALGQVARYGYDVVGNKALSQDFSGVVSQMGYDYSNRLISVSEKGQDGQIHTTYHEYDGKSNRIKTIDYLGNETRYVYDAFNNLIETYLPVQKNTEGNVFQPVIKTTYDSAGRKISETDGEGHTTRTAYNAYNKPTSIQHPDGTEERYIYNFDDTLKTYINTEDTETHYTYDSLKRPLSKTIVAKGEVLTSESFTYHNLLLASHTDPEGHTTYYEYDAAGRKIAEEKAGKRTEYGYDALGRLEKIRKGDLITIKAYDLLDRLIEEKEENPSGELFTKVWTFYDAAGNINLITRFIDGQKCEEAFLYDSFKRLIQKSDAHGNITHIEYEEQKDRGLGGFLVKKTTDALGLQTLEYYDFQDNLNEKIQINSFGEKISHEKMYYDGCGNVFEQHSTIIAGKNHTSAITRWEYDSRSRINVLIEALGSPHQRVTRYTYTSQGLLHELIQPSGIVIEHAYDALGQKISETSSDGTIDHAFRYNNNRHLIEAKDLVHGTTTTREVNAFGDVLSETLGNGLATSSEYDDQGKRILLTLPDHSSVQYSHDGRYLRSITRQAHGQTSFTHHFTHYDFGGYLLHETLEHKGTLLTTHYTYDRTGKRKSTQSPVYTQSILKLDPLGNILQLSTQGKQTVYTYDDFYHVSSEQGIATHSYAYDSHSSRIQKDNIPSPVNLLHECTDQTYDPNGNPIRSGDAIYTYDALGRLTSVQTPTLQAQYIYDPLHRRLAKTVYVKSHDGSWALQTEAHYLYDGQNEIGEISPQGTLRQLRILGRSPRSEADSAIALELEGHLYIPFHDLFGNVACIMTPDGKLVEETFFSAFGEEITTSTLSTLNPWRFASKRLDPETGFILFGRRYYDPHRGRWITPDPAGFTDSLNLYVFVLNNPFSHIDLYGYMADLLAWQSTPWQMPSQNFNDHSWSPPSTLGTNSFLGAKTATQTFDPCGLHVVGTGKTHPNLGFGFANGIRTSLQDSKKVADSSIQKWIGGYDIDVQYNSTYGIIGDVKESLKGLNYEFVEPMKPILEAWDKFFDNNPDGYYFQFTHSQGTINVRNCLQIYPEHRRSRIIVLAISPATYIDRKLCRDVQHFISESDFYVNQLFTRLSCNRPLNDRNHPYITRLRRHKDAPFFFDHSLDSSTFDETLYGYSRNNIRKFGG
jgi:RHS repeat-associated protein